MKRLLLVGLLTSLLATACGALDVGLEGTPTAAQPTSIILPPPPTPVVPSDAAPYRNADLGFSLLLPAGWSVFGPLQATQQGFALYTVGPQAGADSGPEVSQIIVAEAGQTPEQFLHSYCPACTIDPFEAVTFGEGVLGQRTTIGSENAPASPWTFVVHNGQLLGFSFRPRGDQSFEWVLRTIRLEGPIVNVTPTLAPALSGACRVAYAGGSLLYCLGADGAPRLIADHRADGTISHPLISDDGRWVAYLVNYINGTSQLWGVDLGPLVGTDGLALPRQVMADRSQFASDGPDVAISPLRPQWQPGTHTIFFTTRYTQLSGELSLGENLIGDLWSVDADHNRAFNLLPRQSVGAFQFSPDGQHLAVATSQAIRVMRADAADPHVVLEFPVLNLANDVAYLPSLVWSPDSAFFSVALPSADPLAAEAQVDFYRVSVAGAAHKQMTLAGNFILDVQIPLTFSPDGRFAAYGDITFRSPETETMRGDIHLISLETGVDRVVAVDGVWLGFGWAPDSGRYLYATFPAGQGFVAETNGAIQSLGEANWQWINAAWLDSTSFYFTGALNWEPGIYFQRLGQPVQLITTGPVDYGALIVKP